MMTDNEGAEEGGSPGCGRLHLGRWQGHLQKGHGILEEGLRKGLLQGQLKLKDWTEEPGRGIGQGKGLWLGEDHGLGLGKGKGQGIGLRQEQG